jgi:hypothetical protein
MTFQAAAGLENAIANGMTGSVHRRAPGAIIRQS